MIRQIKNKCHNCNGKGKQEAGKVCGKCLYCKGKGYKKNRYGVDS